MCRESEFEEFESMEERRLRREQSEKLTEFLATRSIFVDRALRGLSWIGPAVVNSFRVVEFLPFSSAIFGQQFSRTSSSRLSSVVTTWRFLQIFFSGLHRTSFVELLSLEPLSSNLSPRSRASFVESLSCSKSPPERAPSSRFASRSHPLLTSS